MGKPEFFRQVTRGARVVVGIKRLLWNHGHIAATLALLGVAACGDYQVSRPIQQNFSGPIGVQSSANGKYFFTLNSDFDGQYDDGSLVVLDESGAKQAAITIPRLGRAMKRVGNDLYVGFERPDEKGVASVMVFDVTNPLAITTTRSWVINCSPVNVTARQGYPTFFVSCSGGGLLVGQKDWDALKVVRNYEKSRRAMYLDPTRELLFLFSTEMTTQAATDMLSADVNTYAIDGTVTAGSNEIPDDFENSRVERRNVGNRAPYQFVVYDIAKERAASFPYRELRDKNDPTADNELRWLYFTLLNIDGSPDTDEGVRTLQSKFYRTNIWDAKPNPEDTDSFYISHRGLIQANDIIKITLVGDPRPIAKGTAACANGYVERNGFCVPRTDAYFAFERVYGFKGEVDTLSYVGDFEVLRIKGRRILIVNHFRDLVYWKPADRRFSMVVRDLDFPSWRSELQSTDYQRSYFQVAMTPSGSALTCSYYGGSVILLKVNPGEELIEEKLVD